MGSVFIDLAVIIIILHSHLANSTKDTINSGQI